MMTEIHEAHPQLYHYTNFDGLKGILETQTLWATHFRNLNDSSEIEVMRPHLEEMLFEILKEMHRQKKSENYFNKSILRKHGGIKRVSRKDAKSYTNILYDNMFTGAPSVVPITEPYILSFCAHTKDDEYVKKNGLLSQWRAYGGDGGYALVFDTKRLLECLKVEYENYQYSFCNLSDVVYDDQSEIFKTEFSDLHKCMTTLVTDLISGGKDRPSEAFMRPFFNATTRFKHGGFKEESEVRVCAAPNSEADTSKSSDGMTRELKPILKRPGSHAPYIALNDGPKKKPLPILQIIIGPQKDQQQRAEEVKRLVGKRNIKITCSKTPYLPPQARISG